MPFPLPNFSPFPFDRLPRVTRGDAAIESVLARQLAAYRSRSIGRSLSSVVGGAARIQSIAIADRSFDPYAAVVEVRIGPLSIAVAGSGSAVRALAQRLVGGLDEVAAPRAPTTAEHAIWSLVVAAALADAGIAADVWPLSEAAQATLSRELGRGKPRSSGGLIGRGGLVAEPVMAAPREQTVVGKKGSVRKVGSDVARGSGAQQAIGHDVTLRPGDGPVAPAGPIAVELQVDLAGIPLTAIAWCPRELVFRAPPPRLHDWSFDLPIVVARCALTRDAIDALGVRDVIVVERALELAIGDGVLGLVAVPPAVEATVATGYVRRDMALPDDAHVELTVRLGTTRISLRRLGELAVGEVIALGKPLAGPYEIRAGERAIGQGELVDVDGEIGVRIVSLYEK